MKIPGPDHPISIEPAVGHVRVTFAGHVVAETGHALKLSEAGYPPVYYIPRNDARMVYFRRSEHRTHCPYKGDAGYFTLAVDGKESENAVWTYEEPYPAVAAIKDHLAFYPGQVAIDLSEHS